MVTLLLDALDRTLMAPQCAGRWHGLMAIWSETSDHQARKSVIAELEGLPESNPRADILRLTFLACATGESRFENAAAARVLAVEPDDPDLLAAFMAFQWLSALQYLASRSDFAGALIAARLPEIAKRQMHGATRRLPSEFPPATLSEVRRVAVVVPYVGNQFHTPSVMAVEQAAVLAREGCLVQLFSAQELKPLDVALSRGDGRELALPPFDPQAWGKSLPDGVTMTVSDARFSLSGRWCNLMPALARFDPDVVLLVGLYSPLAAALYTVRPTIGMSVNSVAPIAPLDVLLTANPEAEQHQTWGGAFSSSQAVFYPWRIKRPARHRNLTRTDLGLSESDVIWVSAGFRLEHEIRGEWASRMLLLMASHPRVLWLLIGGDGVVPQALRPAPTGRVRVLATRGDLPAILRCCDICVNPPRMGGGLSVAEAMAEGLPVVSLAGSDGGDKVGDQAQHDLHAYLEYLSALTERPALRDEAGRALRRRFDQRLDLEASGTTLLVACRQATDLARQRLTKPS